MPVPTSFIIHLQNRGVKLFACLPEGLMGGRNLVIRGVSPAMAKLTLVSEAIATILSETAICRGAIRASSKPQPPG